MSYPDQLAPAAGAEAAVEYLGGAGGTAAVAYDGVHRVLLFGFPIEALDSDERLGELLHLALAFLVP